MKNRVLSVVLLAMVVVIALVGVSACTRAKPNRPVASAPTSSPLPAMTTPAETPAALATKVAAPVTSTTPMGNVTPIPLEPSPTMVPGMPTSTVNPPAPAASGPAAAVTLIVPLTPAVESTPIPAPGQPQAQQPNAAGVPTKAYKVKEADTLFGIAVRFGTTVETLKQLNNLTGDMLTVGQDLLVPLSPNATPEAEAAAPAGPAAPAAVAPAAPAISPRTAPAGSRVYVVKPGENLFRIALKYGVSLEAMAQANNIMAPWYTIYVGQRLVVP
jgi:LysM repeat protein